jgi:CubicO group peptidase (beta-lactamase class C family)
LDFGALDGRAGSCNRFTAMNRVSFRVIGLSLIALYFVPSTAQQFAVARLDCVRISSAQIDAAVTRAMRSANVTGAGIAVLNRGTIVYLKAYGLRDTAKGLPLTPDSIMTAASLTKPAFATVVMELVHEHVLDLDRPVYEYLPRPLPEYPRYSDLANDPRYKRITMRMLLDHTSGLPNWRRFMPGQKLRIYFQPGARFAYSGEGIALAQMVLETVTRQPISELMDMRLFQPLGMTRTSMVWEQRFEDDYANGYDEHGRSLGPERRQVGDAAGGMQTTLRDYARFVEAVLDGRVPDRQSREAMLSPQIQILSKHEFPSLDAETNPAGDRAIRLSYGFGWGLFWTPYGKAFFKEGHDNGWRHYVVCFDRDKIAMLIMTNSANGEDIYDPLLRELLGDTFTPLDWEGFRPAH